MTREILIVVPTRERPENAARLIRSFNEGPSDRSFLLLCVDRDDPRRIEYQAMGGFGLPLNVAIRYGPRASLSEWTNRATDEWLKVIEPVVVASLGDDHMLSRGWEDKVLNNFKKFGPGFVYGDDGIQGENLPTACFVSADIVKVLGWMMLPVCDHMFVDNAWKELGLASEALFYDETLKTPHLHPLAGLSEWDDSYRATNSRLQYAKDGTAFDSWRFSEAFDKAVKSIRGIRGKRN